MPVFIHSTDVYLREGLRILTDYCYDSNSDIFFIDLAAFPKYPSPRELLQQQDGRVIFLTPEKYNLTLLSYICADFQKAAFALPRKSNLIELAFTLRNIGKDVNLSKLYPSFTPSEKWALKAFLHDHANGTYKRGNFPPPPDMESKKASYYRQRLSGKLGFRNSQDFYKGLSELSFIYNANHIDLLAL